MRARAPGKLVLTGAYAVLEGAPAIVIAVDRHAIADAARRATVTAAEARHALGDAAPHCDVVALYDGEHKLGLGSSAAALVASLAAVEYARGASLDAAEVRARIFADARAAHAAVQAGGSGVDVAACTYGGALRYAVSASGEATIRPVALPGSFVWRAFFSGKSARTSELRARVDRFKAEHALAYEDRMRELRAVSIAAADAFEDPRSEAQQVVERVRDFGESLARLGDAADVPIVPREWRRLCDAAKDEGGSFSPAGAGGGDVGVFSGTKAPSPAFERLAAELSMTFLPLSLDPIGVSAE